MLDREKLAGNNLLEDILEEDIPECEFDDDDDDPRTKKGTHLFRGYGGQDTE